MAYQICFDLYESASQQFLSSVIQNLRTVGTPIASVPGSTNTGTVPGSEKDRWGSRRGALVQLQFCSAGASCVRGSALQVIELLYVSLGNRQSVVICSGWNCMLPLDEFTVCKNAFSLQFREAGCICVIHVAQLMSSSALMLWCCVLLAETGGVKGQLWAKGTWQSHTALASHTCKLGGDTVVLCVLLYFQQKELAQI